MVGQTARTKISASTGTHSATISRRSRGLLVFLFVSTADLPCRGPTERCPAGSGRLLKHARGLAIVREGNDYFVHTRASVRGTHRSRRLGGSGLGTLELTDFNDKRLDRWLMYHISVPAAIQRRRGAVRVNGALIRRSRVNP